MPEEVFIIVVVAILAGTFTTVVKAVIAYLNNRNAPSGGENSLTTSELRRIVGDAVQDATEPLHRRLDEMDADLKRRLPPARETRVLPEAEDVARPR